MTCDEWAEDREILAMTRLYTVVTLIALLLFTTGSVRGGIIVYTSRPAWQAAVIGSIQTEDFQSAPLQSALAADVTHTLGLLDFSYSGAPETTFPKITDIGNTDGTRELAFRLFPTNLGGGTTRPGPMTITFPNQVTAFGADFFDLIGGAQPIQITVAGETRTFTSVLSGGENITHFFGVTSDTPFDDFVIGIGGNSGIGNDFDVDNVSFSSIPEPSTAVMMSLAALCFGGYARRWQKRAVA